MSLFRPPSNSPRAGNCRGCSAHIQKGEVYQKGFGLHPFDPTLWKAGQYPFKLCEKCMLDPSPELSREEMLALERAIDLPSAMPSAVPSAVPSARASARASALPYGFYKTEDSDGNHFPGRHAFSNFSLEDLKIPGVTDEIGAFRCSESLIMLIKALTSRDGQVAFILTRTRLTGSTSKALGRMVLGFNKVKAKWAKMTPIVARYVAGLKMAQCAKFKKRALAVAGRPVFECSETDKVWGTGTALGEPIGTGTNYLGVAIGLAITDMTDSSTR